MFGKKKDRNDTNDFFKMSAGQLLALFKNVGGKAGAEQILQGHGALTALAPEPQVFKSVECKVGLPVASSFYGVLTSYMELGCLGDKAKQLMTKWAIDTLANESLQSVQVDLCRVSFEDLTGITDRPDKLRLDELLRVVRYPYCPIPVEMLPQIAHQLKRNPYALILPMESGVMKNLWDLPEDWSYSFNPFPRENEAHTIEMVIWGVKDKQFQSWSAESYLVMRSPQPFTL